MGSESESKSERVCAAVTPSELERILRAAEVLGDREHMSITISDVVRSGALKRAEEIIGVETPA